MRPCGNRTFSDIESLVVILNENLSSTERANCFNAVELFWSDSQLQRFVGPEEFISYISKKFIQISLSDDLMQGDVTIVWSRNSLQLPLGQIFVEELLKKREGYPFGLIIEHSFVSVDSKIIFEKTDPKPSTLYRIISKKEALAPYQSLNGYELTRHRRL